MSDEMGTVIEVDGFDDDATSTLNRIADSLDRIADAAELIHEAINAVEGRLCVEGEKVTWGAADILQHIEEAIDQK